MKPSLALPALLAWSAWAASPAVDGLSAAYAFTRPPPGQPALVTRVDATVDFQRGSGEAALPGYPATDYSVTWTGGLRVPADGTYTFSVTADDCARLWIGERWVLDRLSYNGGSATTVQATVALKGGMVVPLLLRLWQGPGVSRCRLEWEGPGIARQVIPATSLSTEGWTRLDAPSESWESPASVILHQQPGEARTETTFPAGRIVGGLQPAGPTTMLAEVELLRDRPVGVILNPSPAAALPATSTGTDGILAGLHLAGPPMLPDAAGLFSGRPIPGARGLAVRAIGWKPVDLAAPPASLAVRARSRILVQARPGHPPYLSHGYDRQAIPVDGRRVGVVSFPRPGEYRIEDGDGGAHVDIVAVGLDIPAEVAGGALYVQALEPVLAPVPVLPLSAQSTVVVGSFEHNLKVNVAATAAGNQARVEVFCAGERQKAFARLGADGPILSLIDVCGYSLSHTDARIDTTLADGSESGLASIYIHPFYRNLRFDLRMRAHTAAFSGGATSFTAPSDGTPTSLGTPGFVPFTMADGLQVGVLDFRVFFPPGEAKWCFTAVGSQVAK